MSDSLMQLLTASPHNVSANVSEVSSLPLTEVSDLWGKYGQYIFDSADIFAQWIAAPNPNFDNHSPFAMRMLTGSWDEVDNLLGRMAYGNLA